MLEAAAFKVPRVGTDLHRNREKNKLSTDNALPNYCAQMHRFWCEGKPVLPSLDANETEQKTIPSEEQ